MELDEDRNPISGISGNFEITLIRCNLLTFTFDRSRACHG